MAAAKYKDAIVDFIQNDKKLTESVVQASATNDNANVDELTMDLAAMLASHAHHLQEQHDANNNNNSNNDNANGAKISEETHGIIEHFLVKYGVNKKGAATIAENILKLLKKPSDIPGNANNEDAGNSSGGSKKFKAVAYCIRVLLTIVEKKVDVFTALKMEAGKKK